MSALLHDHRAAVRTLPSPALQVQAVPDALAGTRFLFAAYLAVLAIEYGGLGNLFPLLKVLRVSTVLGWAVSLGVIYKVGTNAFVEYRQSRMLLFLVLWTGATVLWAVVRSYVPDNFRYMCDYFGLFLGTLYLIDRPSRVKHLSVLMSGLIVFLVVQNLDKMNAAVRIGSFKAAYFMGDGNDFGWGLVTMMLFPLYLIRPGNGTAWRLVGVAAIGVGLLGIVGTESRGATLSVLGALAFQWIFFSTNRVRDAVLAAALLVGWVSLAPSNYLSRMQTLENYSEDNSAQGRLRAWGASMRMAVDFPLGVGAGNFNSAYGRYYRPDDLDGWAANRWISAHSVYFKVLGEYGLLGLIALLVVIFGNVGDNVRSFRALVRAGPGRASISPYWPAAVGVGMVGYSVAGIFLGGIAYPHLFMLTGLTLGCRRMLAGTRAEVPTASGPTTLPRLQGGHAATALRPRAAIGHHAILATRPGPARRKG